MIQLIQACGDNATRARHTGEQSSQRLAMSLQTYEHMFAICGIDWKQACERGMRFLDSIENTFPSIIEEIEQLAIGAGTDIASIAALNARTEILPANYLTIAAADKSDQLAPGNFPAECTSLAVSNNNPSKNDSKSEMTDCWLAQTWDWLGSQRDALVMLQAKHKDSSPQYMTATEAGMLAKIGFNKHGFGITLNILRSPDDGSADGVPVHLFLRRLLDCESVDDACDLARRTAFSSSSNVLIADCSGAIASLELSPRGVRIIQAESTPNCKENPLIRHSSLCHTNHFLHPDFSGIDDDLTANLSTASRLKQANRAVASISDLDGIRRLLSDTSGGDDAVCRFPNEKLPPGARLETVFAVAMNLDKKEFWATEAQPSISDFRRYPFFDSMVP